MKESQFVQITTKSKLITTVHEEAVTKEKQKKYLFKLLSTHWVERLE